MLHNEQRLPDPTEVHCPLEDLLPTLFHVQVIKHLNQGDGNLIDSPGYHWLLQEVGRKLERGRREVGRKKCKDSISFTWNGFPLF